jgi:hypothetical protein
MTASAFLRPLRLMSLSQFVVPSDWQSNRLRRIYMASPERLFFNTSQPLSIHSTDLCRYKISFYNNPYSPKV